jgi:RecJ-like exonuclease
MTNWKDICREKNGSYVCDSADACSDCANRAARMTDTTHEAPDLLPCPFCGGKGYVFRDHCPDGGGIFLSVRCHNCRAESGEKYCSQGNDCPQTYQEVRDAWNARADTAQALEAERDALAEKLTKAVEALEKLARLGNGDRYGNSDGNMIARATLAELKGQDDD